MLREPASRKFCIFSKILLQFVSLPGTIAIRIVSDRRVDIKQPIKPPTDRHKRLSADNNSTAAAACLFLFDDGCFFSLFIFLSPSYARIQDLIKCSYTALYFRLPHTAVTRRALFIIDTSVNRAVNKLKKNKKKKKRKKRKSLLYM